LRERDNVGGGKWEEGKKNGGIIQDGDGISEKFGLPIQFSPPI
jgi:hypothetical protein